MLCDCACVAGLVVSYIMTSSLQTDMRYCCLFFMCGLEVLQERRNSARPGRIKTVLFIVNHSIIPKDFLTTKRKNLNRCSRTGHIFFYSMRSPSSKPAAYITHNAAQPLTVLLEIGDVMFVAAKLM